jgi:Xaa-Pro dipeptidase
LSSRSPAERALSVARIEEEVVVTDRGCKVITRFPAEELPTPNAY